MRAKVRTLGHYRRFPLPPEEKTIPRSHAALFALLVCVLFIGGVPTPTYASDSEAPKTEAPGPDAKKDSRILGYWQRGEGEAVIEVLT